MCDPTFSRFSRTPTCDRQTDTDTGPWLVPRMHRAVKTRSHHTGVSPSSLAPCYCPYSVQNRTADIQDTHYKSTHQPSYIYDLLQPHCSSRQHRSASRNLLRISRMITGFAQRSFAYPTVLHTPGTVYLTSSMATWTSRYDTIRDAILTCARKPT